MARSDRCPHCGALVLPQEKFCAQCGGPLDVEAPEQEAPEQEATASEADSTIRLEMPAQAAPAPAIPTRPQTIEALKAYCAANGMPLERMRFFIGQDYRQPRAFGIYRDGDQFVVYKNKGDGSRAVRYHGPDEAYAVNELFQKLLDECHLRGIYPDGKPELTEAVAKAAGVRTGSAVTVQFKVGKAPAVTETPQEPVDALDALLASSGQFDNIIVSE